MEGWSVNLSKVVFSLHNQEEDAMVGPRRLGAALTALVRARRFIAILVFVNVALASAVVSAPAQDVGDPCPPPGEGEVWCACWSCGVNGTCFYCAQELDVTEDGCSFDDECQT
jgi:hypothetical protein